MRKKLALIVTMLAMVIGPLSQAQAALASGPAAAASGARVRTPVSIAGSGAAAAIRVAAAKRQLARRPRPRAQGTQRSLPGRLTPDALPGATTTQPPPHALATPVYAYIANDVLSVGSVTPVAVATGIAGTPIPVGKGPVALAMTPDGTTVYVANDGSGTVTPIATATNTAGPPIPVGHYPHAIAITPDGTTAYVACYDGTVVPIDTATGTAGPPIQAGNEPAAIAITPDGTTAYVVNNVLSGTVTPITLATRTVGAPIPVGGKPVALAIAPDGTTVYVANLGSGTVTPIATATGTPGPPITVGEKPEGIAITPDGKTAYVANFGDDTVTPIATATGRPRAAIHVGHEPEQIAITPDGKTAYVGDSGDGTDTPITTADDQAGTPIPVGNGGGAIALPPAPQLPAAPGSLTATLAGSSVSLTWKNSDAAGAATGISVERATDAAFTKNVTDIPLGPAETSYTDTSVVEGTTYYYRVHALNQIIGGNSAWSNDVSILVAVPAPANLTAKAYPPRTAPAKVVLTWTESPAAGVTGFIVERAADARFTRNVTDIPVGPAAASYTDTSVAVGTRYYYRVLAQNQARRSAWSNAVSILVRVPAPANLTARAYAPGNAPARMVLTWTESRAAGISGFIVERATNARFTLGFAWVRVGARHRSVTLRGLLRNHRYHVRILAFNGPATSAWTNLTTTTPGSPRCRPGRWSTHRPGRPPGCPPWHRPRSRYR